jgi:hypothetical protein
MLAPEAADANGIVEALPWAEGGVSRPGTAVRLLAREGKLVVVTGGALSDEEGRFLFEIPEKLRDVLLSAYIVPPQSAASELITHMYESESAPSLPTIQLPKVREFDGISSVMLFLGFLIKSVSPVAGIIAFVISLTCVIIARLNNSKLNTILADPEYIVATRWSTGLPQRTDSAATDQMGNSITG